MSEPNVETPTYTTTPDRNRLDSWQDERVGLQGKVERLRDLVETLYQEIGVLRRVVGQLRQHAHADGQIVEPMKLNCSRQEADIPEALL